MMPLRLAVLCDYAEENWPSMDHAAAMLLDRFHAQPSSGIQATRVQPRMKRCVPAAFLGFKWRNAAFNADRLLNRFWLYPRHARKLQAFDLFHVIDHSYSHLLHRLNPQRTVVTCHDIDTFRCVLDPTAERRPAWFRAMVRHTLTGLQKAAAIICVSEATRAQLLKHRIAKPERIHVVSNGIHPCYRRESDPLGDAEAARLLGPAAGRLEILHVGSTIPRKRVDILLRAFAEVREHFPNVHLVRVGAALTDAQQHLAQELKIDGALTSLGFLPESILAAVYRRASLLLVCSDTEGFGLPLAEAMACGTPVIASEIPALCEVSGGAAVHCQPGCGPHWSAAVIQMLNEKQFDTPAWNRRIESGLTQARKFSWDRNARETAAVYRTLLSRNGIG